MKIEILYSSECPGHDHAQELVKEIVKEEGIDANVQSIEVHNDEEARQREFLGSPTIIVDGMDVEPEAREDEDYGVRCRKYMVDGEEQAWPSPEMIRRAVREASHTTPIGASA